MLKELPEIALESGLTNSIQLPSQGDIIACAINDWTHIHIIELEFEWPV